MKNAVIPQSAVNYGVVSHPESHRTGVLVMLASGRFVMLDPGYQFPMLSLVFGVPQDWAHEVAALHDEARAIIAQASN